MAQLDSSEALQREINNALPPPPANPPHGVVTFLYTDIENSTRRWELLPQRDGPMDRAVRLHNKILIQAALDASGFVFRSTGDGFCVAFQSPFDGLRAALKAQQALQSEPFEELKKALAALPGADPSLADGLRARFALHSGVAEFADGTYFSAELNRVGRLLPIGYGAQTLVSSKTQSLLADGIPPGVILRSLGHHRLKDLREETEVFQLCADGLARDFPRLKSLDPDRHNLPIQATSFVGRVRQIDTVVRLVAANKLVLLTGFSGVGKTRLALQCAADLIGKYERPRDLTATETARNTGAFPGDCDKPGESRVVDTWNDTAGEPEVFEPRDGVWLVDLSTVSDATVLFSKVAKVSGIQESPGKDLTEAIISILKDKKLLLVLDNCEQVAADVGRFVDALLGECVEVRVLATSRIPLDNHGGAAFKVPPMEVPDPACLERLRAQNKLQSLARFESIQHFIRCARLGAADFKAGEHNIADIVRICNRVDGLPLAIRMAATHACYLSAKAVADRLDPINDMLKYLVNLAKPGDSLKALIKRNCEALSETERTLVRRLAVFSGGWTLDAAEAVCIDPTDSDSTVLTLMASLVSKSLVEVRRVTEVDQCSERYYFLEVMRQYAWDQLKSDKKECRELEEKHLRWCLAEAREGDSKFSGPVQKQWLERLDREHDNFRAALDRHFTTVAPRKNLLALVAALRVFWCKRGYFTECSQLIKKVLDRDVRGHRTLERAAALAAAGYVAEVRGDLVQAAAFTSEALAIREELKDAEGAATCHINLGIIDFGRCNYDEARRHFDQAMQAFIERQDLHGQTRAMGNIGYVAYLQGNAKEAIDFQNKVMLLCERTRDDGRMALARYRAGTAAIDVPDLDLAEGRLTGALKQMRDLGDKWGMVVCVEGFGTLAARRNRYLCAGRLLGAAESLRVLLGTPRISPEQSRFEQVEQCVRRAAATESKLPELEQALAEGRQMSIEAGVAFALALQDGPASAINRG